MTAELDLVCGEDWSASFQYLSSPGGAAQVMSSFSMDFRQTKISTGTAIIRFGVGQAGTLTWDAPTSTLTASLTSAQTLGLQSFSGVKGYWDLFAVINTKRVRVAAGMINIIPNVTAA